MRLGSPERKLPPLIHVAGTNGKGSLVAYLRAMAEAAGYRVHVYTSPHLVRFNERIRIAGRLIDDDALDEMLTECEEANGDTPISFFDITTALAFLAFSRVPADLGIIEVGMGGRFDSTNVIEPGSVGHHAGRLRPHGLPRRQARRHRLGEGGHHQARDPRRDRPSARRERAGDRGRGGQARRAAVPHGPRVAGDAEGRRASATKAIS